MDAVAVAPLKYRRWLPYWAVLQTDFKQTLRSWVYRLWFTVCILATVGYLLFRFGIHSEAWIMQSASLHTSNLIRAVVLGSLALIVILTVSSISSERGTLADSVLSRGISRYQYFLAKWHSRALVVLMTFALVSGVMLLGSHFLLSEDLTLQGSLVAVITIAAILFAIVSWGVTVGALANSTLVGITIVWIGMYGVGFLLTLLPPSFPSPDRILAKLPNILRGNYDADMMGDVLLVSMGTSFVAGVVGMWGFARKDV